MRQLVMESSVAEKRDIPWWAILIFLLAVMVAVSIITLEHSTESILGRSPITVRRVHLGWRVWVNEVEKLTIQTGPTKSPTIAEMARRNVGPPNEP
jgi:hypothetical protein